MNRPVKFRAWVVGLAKEPMMIYQYKPWEFLIDFKGTLVIHDYMIKKSFEEDGYKLMQFTGLHDKNGKEIYEGDVVTSFEDTFSKDDMQIRVVKLCDGGFRMLYVDKEDGVADWHDGHTVDEILSEKIEIIGDIYRDPELLEGTNQ